MEKEPQGATLVEVDDEGNIIGQMQVAELNFDLTASVDVAAAVGEPLIANLALSSQGFTLVGQGFVLDGEEARTLCERGIPGQDLLRPYLSGRDITRRPRDQFVVDFGTMSEDEARAYPVLFDLIRTRVKPLRDSNSDPTPRKYWWRFGRNREELREALSGLDRYIATSETSRHRFFVFLPSEAACSHAIVVIALDDAYHLGILSSTIHEAWSLAAGGRLGVGNDPRYQKSVCFDTFPFPEVNDDLRAQIGDTAEQLHRHRQHALERDDSLTMTGIYNVLAKLRSGEALSDAERATHLSAACGVLKDLHDQLDSAVARGYGWSWPLPTPEVLQNLVQLHDARCEAERSGEIHWLRPEYQRPKFAVELPAIAKELPLPEMEAEESGEQTRPAWPKKAPEQIELVQNAVATEPGSVEEIAARFHNARRELVSRHLETLQIMGEVRRTKDGRYHDVAGPPEAYTAASQA